MADAAACYITPGPVVQRGSTFDAVARFWHLDAETGDGVLTSPASVVFTVLAPDSTEQTYELGDANVAELSEGVFSCALGPELPVGIYHVAATGSGSDGFDAQSPDTDVTVVESAVDAPAPPPRPVMGPCSQWIGGQDVADCTGVDYDQAPYVFDSVAFEASAALYEVSDRRFPGICERTVRPCRDSCSCWLTGPISYGFGPWFWTSVPWGFGGWAWYNESGDKFGCAPMSKVRLAGDPVSEILEVLIGGEELPEFDPDTGFRNWRLDKWRYLVRMDAPGSPSQPRFWPSCQNMSLDDDQPGTFSVRYRWGTDVPQLGRSAAVEVANQLYLACGGVQCALPAGVTKVVRQGIEIDRGLLANWMDDTKGTGLVNLDLFLNSYGHGKRAGRKSALWSPDVQAFARRVGVPGTRGGS